MTPEEYLSQVIDIDKEIRCLDYGRRKILNTNVKATQWQQDKSFSLDVSRPNEEVVIKLEEYNDSITEKQKELIDLLGTISREIDEVSISNHRTLLMYRYIYGLKFKDIAKHMHYSDPYVYDVHRNALKSFRKAHPNKDWIEYLSLSES